MRLLLICVVVVVCGSAQAADNLFTKAKAAISQMLRDPASAIYTKVTIKNGAVCGYVNAKNASGVMTGPQPFYFDGTRARIVVAPDGRNNPMTGSPEILSVKYSQSSTTYAKLCR
jgi:hypothetical protein